MKKVFSILLLAVVCLSFFVRFYKLGEVPSSLNPDEVALGYNAYSILKTGADEHGNFLPLTMKSFGDWKLSGYSYLDILPILLFDLNQFSVRIPSAVAGVIGVLLIFKISFELFGKKSIALISSFLFAISPWSIYFSRVAYEVNVATTFFLGGLYVFLRYINNQKRNSKQIILSSFLFGIPIFIYHSYAIFLPFFLTALIIINFKKLNINKSSFLAFCLISAFFIIFLNSIMKGSLVKISTLNIFNDPNIIYERVEKLRGDQAGNQFTERLIHNKYFGVFYQIGQNYINSYSPSFLFDKGGEKLLHNLGFFGSLYLFDALLLFLGLAGIFWNREENFPLILIWLLIAPISSMITRDTPNSTRLFVLMPVLILISSYGMYQLINILNKNWHKRCLLGITLSIFILNLIFFFEIYFVHFNTQRIRFWHFGYKEAVELAQKYPNYKTVMTGPDNFPYIYFLFYNKYDPIKFRNEVSYYPVTSDGFQYVKSFGRYSFAERTEYDKAEKNTLYIDHTMLGDKSHSIRLPSGEPIFGYYTKN